MKIQSLELLESLDGKSAMLVVRDEKGVWQKYSISGDLADAFKFFMETARIENGQQRWKSRSDKQEEVSGIFRGYLYERRLQLWLFIGFFLALILFLI